MFLKNRTEQEQNRNFRVFIDQLTGSVMILIRCVHVLSSASYYVNGRDTSLEDFLDPEVLDTLALKTGEVLQVKTSSAGEQVCV